MGSNSVSDCLRSVRNTLISDLQKSPKLGSSQEDNHSTLGVILVSSIIIITFAMFMFVVFGFAGQGSCSCSRWMHFL